MTPNTPSHNEEEILKDFNKTFYYYNRYYANHPIKAQATIGRKKIRDAVALAISTLRNSIESEVRETLGKEIVENLEKLPIPTDGHAAETVNRVINLIKEIL